MVINMHAHLANRNHFSEKYWDNMITEFSKGMDIPKDVLVTTMFEKIWSSDADVYIEQMNAAGIDKALVHHPDWGLSKIGEPNWSIKKINQWYVDEVSRYPDRLFTILGCDPRRGDEALELLEIAANKWQLKGVKIYPSTGFYPDNPKFFPFYEKCVDLGLTLYSHTGVITPPGLEAKYADPIYLDSVASAFPNLKIVMFHFGGSSITWSHKCLELMLGRPNLYTEISGNQPAAIGMTREWLTMLRAVFDIPCPTGLSPGDRIMFGSDWPFVGMMDDKTWIEFIRDIPNKAKEYDLNFTQNEIDKLLYINAQNFLEDTVNK